MVVTQVREPTIPITEIEQSAFCQTDEELKSKTLEEEFESGVRWQKIPISYLKMTPEELDVRISEARSALGERLVVLGHHYQRNEIIKFADIRGDSFKLSQYATLSKEHRKHRVLRCPLHGRDSGYPERPRAEGHTAELDCRVLHGRHGAHR